MARSCMVRSWMVWRSYSRARIRCWPSRDLLLLYCSLVRRDLRILRMRRLMTKSEIRSPRDCRCRFPLLQLYFSIWTVLWGSFLGSLGLRWSVVGSSWGEGQSPVSVLELVLVISPAYCLNYCYFRSSNENGVSSVQKNKSYWYTVRKFSLNMLSYNFKSNNFAIYRI
jgi:hypothetical protein